MRTDGKTLTIDELRFLREHELYHWYFTREWYDCEAHVCSYKRHKWEVLGNAAIDYCIEQLLKE
jgi:hypothetical protein